MLGVQYVRGRTAYGGGGGVGMIIKGHSIQRLSKEEEEERQKKKV